MPPHSDEPHPPIIVDATTLTKFRRLSRFDLLTGLGTGVQIVEEVQAEMLDLEPGPALTEAFQKGDLQLCRITILEDIRLAVKLYDDLGLGRGEASSIVAARRKKVRLALNERAVKLATRYLAKMTVFTPQEIILQARRQGRLSAKEARYLERHLAEPSSAIQQFCHTS